MMTRPEPVSRAAYARPRVSDPSPVEPVPYARPVPPVRRPTRRRAAPAPRRSIPDETPLSRTRRARRMARELARDPPRRALRARLHQRLRAAGRHGALGADHRQDGQQGDADAVRPLPRRRRAGRRRPRRAGDDPQADRLLPGQGQLGARAEPGAGRAVRRRGARPDGGPGHPARASAARPRTSSSATRSASPG